MPKVYRVQAELFIEIELIASDADDAIEKAFEINPTEWVWSKNGLNLFDCYCIGDAEPEYPNREDDRHAD